MSHPRPFLRLLKMETDARGGRPAKRRPPPSESIEEELMLMAMRSGLYEGIGPGILDRVRNEILSALEARDSIGVPEVPETRPLTRLNLTYVVDELLEKGVVTRESPRRSGLVVLRLTERGRELLGAAPRLRKAG